MFIARCRAIACYGSQSITDVSSNAYARCRAIACYGSHSLNSHFSSLIACKKFSNPLHIQNKNFTFASRFSATLHGNAN